MSETGPTFGAGEIRAALLEGTVPIDDLPEALHCTLRTVYRLNLPYIKIAGKRRVILALARERFMARTQGGDLPPPRKPGRPRKNSM